MASSRFCLVVLLLAQLPFLSAHAVSLGTASGLFEVNASGVATYTVPIQVLPGVNGVEPKLALVYSSQQGNGLTGVSWLYDPRLGRFVSADSIIPDLEDPQSLRCRAWMLESGCA